MLPWHFKKEIIIREKEYIKKGGSLHSISGMKLFRKPFRPTVDDLHQNGRNFPPNFLHESWMDYLYWDVELEP